MEGDPQQLLTEWVLLPRVFFTPGPVSKEPALRILLLNFSFIGSLILCPHVCSDYHLIHLVSHRYLWIVSSPRM